MCEVSYKILHNDPENKYQLTKDYNLFIKQLLRKEVKSEFINIIEGNLHIKAGYKWNGPSGPAVDTVDFLRASLVHDAFYDLIRQRKLPYRYKYLADRLLRNIAREDGMSHFRSNYSYLAVFVFGFWAIRGRELKKQFNRVIVNFKRSITSEK